MTELEVRSWSYVGFGRGPKGVRFKGGPKPILKVHTTETMEVGQYFKIR